MKNKYGLLAEFYWRGKPKVRKKRLSATSFATSTTWTGVWLNPVLRGRIRRFSGTWYGRNHHFRVSRKCSLNLQLFVWWLFASKSVQN